MVAALALAVVTSACSDDDDAGPEPTTTAPDDTTTSTVASVENEPDLEPYLLDVGALPDGFIAVADEIDDTITAFCAGEDATAGLSASGRAAVGFTRNPAGASVIQLVFRFDDDGAERFVAAADAILARCSEVPDFTGLAFTYEPVAPEVAAALEGADTVASRHGTSVGSEQLTTNVAVMRHGDIGQLVAVLVLDEPRAALDELTRSVFAEAAQRASAAA